MLEKIWYADCENKEENKTENWKEIWWHSDSGYTWQFTQCYKINEFGKNPPVCTSAAYISELLN
jgi:hypothetical protein